MTKNFKENDNPLLTEFNTPFNVPDFERIHNHHFKPAFIESIRLHDEEITTIINNNGKPTFENTIIALDNSGVLLDNIRAIFFNLLSANTNDTLQEIAPLLSKHKDDIYLNKELFSRVQQIYASKETLQLSTEESTVLRDYYKEFIRSGANLNNDQQNRLREINESLSKLTLKFGDNVLSENNTFKLFIDNVKDLEGLPESIRYAASEDAKAAGSPDKWLFTIHKPSLIPFLKYADNRILREKMFKAYILKGDHNDKFDNKEIIKKIIALRSEKAHLLGYKNHASYILEKNMSGTSENVIQFLDQVWKPALEMAKKEVTSLQELIDKEGGGFVLQPWDWWFYAEKLRKEKYDLDEEALRPYFSLENVRNGIFMVVNKLYGLKFIERKDIPKYHKEAITFEVQEANGSHVGILYLDFFPRASKKGGAWMTSYRKQSRRGGKENSPVISIVCNFTKPTSDSPSLLSLDETLTFFHEFGHALHGLLSNCTYYKTSGTSVPRDFVELPSQIMENWAVEPEVLKMYAKHYKTEEPIPNDLIDKINNSKYFNQGFETVEYLAASYLDMSWHTISNPTNIDVNDFETHALNKIGLIPEIIVRYRSTYFSHIFQGNYSAGYYSYIWAEVLDADAFQAFKEKSLFDQETALAFRKNILSKGGTNDPMKLYIEFRGKEPDINPMLTRKGLN